MSVPESHDFGEVGSSWVKRIITGSDDRLKLLNLNPLNDELFSALMARELQKKLAGKRSALVYIHGYNNDFEESVIRAAQIGVDLKVEGVTALFSWPSKGAALAYKADGKTIQASEQHFEAFLRNIASNPSVDEVNILAHSMGNRALLRTVERLARDPSFGSKVINQIILAAPDVNTRLFTQLAKYYPKIAKRTTLYVSSKDLALWSSGIVDSVPRAGFTPPITIVPDIDTVDVSNIDLTILGHSYFGNLEHVLHDMFDLLMFGAVPQKRIRLKEKLSADNKTYWEISK